MPSSPTRCPRSTGKLYALGCGLERHQHHAAAGAPRPLGLGVIIRVPYTATNAVHRFEVRIDDSDGRSIPIADAPPGAEALDGKLYTIDGHFNVGRPPQLTPGDDQIVVIAMNIDGLVFEKADAYNVVIEIDGDEVKRLSIRVTLRASVDLVRASCRSSAVGSPSISSAAGSARPHRSKRRSEAEPETIASATRSAREVESSPWRTSSHQRAGRSEARKDTE